jgi:hypothetical protein
MHLGLTANPTCRYTMLAIFFIMERIIRTLQEMREKAERSFIDNSIIVHRASLDSPIPDTKSDLEMIIELKQAISILQNANAVKRVLNGD